MSAPRRRSLRPALGFLAATLLLAALATSALAGGERDSANPASPSAAVVLGAQAQPGDAAATQGGPAATPDAPGQGTAPDAQAPDAGTLPPDGSAPDSSITPENPTPDGSAPPEAAAPDAGGQATPAPDASAPNASGQDGSPAPEASAPDDAAPAPGDEAAPAPGAPLKTRRPPAPTPS